MSYTGIGDECSRAGECYMPQDPESVECRNSMCQCKIGYKSERNVCKVRSKKSKFSIISILEQKMYQFLLKQATCYYNMEIGNVSCLIFNQDNKVSE